MLLATTGAVLTGAARDPLHLPPIVFVCRNPVPGDPTAIPGLGPHHRAIVTGGRLLVRESDGRVRELLRPGEFDDVSDPSVSPDGRRVAFAGVRYHSNAWRIWMVDLTGGDPVQVTYDQHERSGVINMGGRLSGPGSHVERFDDLDPCWIDDSTLVFASTRYPQRAQYADLPVTNLFRVSVPTGKGIVFERAGVATHWPIRLTAERNGAEEPAMDWASGRLLFSRWWFNRYRAADTPAGITADSAGAIVRDTVNLWQVMSMSLLDHRARLAAGDLRTRRGEMGYQPSALKSGSIAAVYAANLGLSPRPGGTGIQALAPSFGPARRLIGAIVSGKAGDVYSGTEGLAPPSACSPQGLPDGRVLFSYSPGARGDFGLYVMNADGSHVERVLDYPETLELDAVAVVRRAPPPREKALAAEEFEDVEKAARGAAGARPRGPDENQALVPPMERTEITDAPTGGFRFHDLDVFADAPAGSPGHGAPRRTAGARLRFYATLARPGQVGGDSAILLREVPVGANGEVNERGLPPDMPMFEQLVGPDGRVLMTAHGPAHVAGSNVGVAGYAARCVGCHLGHSTLPIASVSRSTGGAR